MMNKTIICGRYSGRTFIPEEPLPDEEGTAELVILSIHHREKCSIFDAIGRATNLRTGEDILAQTQAEREEWGDRRFTLTPT